MLGKSNLLFQDLPITKIFIIAPFIKCMNKLYADCDDKPKATHIPLNEKFLLCGK